MFDAEQVHHNTLSIAAKLPSSASLFPIVSKSERYRFRRNDMTWDFPIGIAAGFDKNAQALEFFKNMGVGALEVGTITKKPQVGNAKPRVFRYPETESIRNAMGFPNDGMEKIFKRLHDFKSSGFCIGANLGKNKDTSIDDTPNEYALLYEKFAPVSDYLVINISSPNTPGLREFQSMEQLSPLLDAVLEKRKFQPKPLFVKISPDLSEEDIDIVCELSKEKKLSGVIATNTSSKHDFGVGGLSGRAISEYSAKVRKIVCQNLREDGDQTIIGVGGVSSYEDLRTFWKQGGHFMQVYTSLIYQGPKLLVDIKDGIDQDMKTFGVNNLSELIERIKLS